MPYNESLGIDLGEAFEGSFFLQGSNDILIYFCPGWSETPKSLQPAACYLHHLGYSVVVPSYPDYSSTIKWTDWWSSYWTRLLEIREYGVKKIYLAGFSMGGLFSLLASTLSDQLEQDGSLQVMGIIAISPPLTLQWKSRLPTSAIRVTSLDRPLAQGISRFRPTIPFKRSEIPFAKYRGSDLDRPIISVIELIRSIRFTNRTLQKYPPRKPTLVLLARKDEVVHNKKTERITMKRLAHVKIAEVMGGHNCLLDHSCRIVCDTIHQFITQTKES
ncbi:alpha/beta hydrolase [Shimazuella kribbensis]|uniref:alpha/beta hydrolase n=1 Tax=Shimazuella kribbensis TaxID=139808 RepID=UPI000401BF1F|nr:alpha/beta fold hydrolase [Shimazuella kribbensis]